MGAGVHFRTPAPPIPRRVRTPVAGIVASSTEPGISWQQRTDPTLG